MIGNDIVDLNFAQNHRRLLPRVLDKLFTQKEQQKIHDSENPSIQIWLLWSMKEAAYKLYLQVSQSKPFYNPKAFECHFNDKTQVSFGNFLCDITSKITINYIISEANLAPQKMRSKVVIFDQPDYKSQSLTLKDKLINDVAQHFNINFRSLLIQKTKSGIPFLVVNNQMFNVSLTHHGYYGAYAF